MVSAAARYDSIVRALSELESTYSSAWESAHSIVIIPDLLYADNVITPADSVRAILDVITEHTNKRITIAAAPFHDHNPFHGNQYHNFLQRYGVKFLNVNHDNIVPIQTSSGSVGVSSTLIRSAIRIVIAHNAPDTHCITRSPLAVSLLSALSRKDRDEYYNNLDAVKKDILPLVKPHIAILDSEEIRASSNVRDFESKKP